MIDQLFPIGFQRYVTLPVLGSVMDSYSAWLHDQRYTRRSSMYELRMAAHVCRFLKKQGRRQVEDVGEKDLQACHLLFRRKFPKEAGSVRVLGRFLLEHGYVQPVTAPEPSRTDLHLNNFMAALLDARGLVRSTIRRQGQFAAEFLDWLKFEEEPDRLTSLSSGDIEGFIRHLGKRMGRVSLQKAIATIRNFLRFLATAGVVTPGLASQIDSPRVYRQEQLPRALPWTTVQAFLRSIDRKSAIGKRDYAVFSIMATYGLRAGDVAALTLDDIQWRAGRIRICQSKTGEPLELPLTDDVSSAIYDYLKRVPRYGKYRQVFLRLRAPGGAIKTTTVTEAFQSWSIKSGLDIPFKGTHCLRHSYALHLLRHGLPLKTIGDLLGHRSPESTGAYIRLATDDLRDVALHVPTSTKRQKEGLS